MKTVNSCNVIFINIIIIILYYFGYNVLLDDAFAWFKFYFF